MAGWNLQTYAEEFRRIKLLGLFSTLSSEAISDSLLFRLFTRAFSELQRYVQLVRAQDSTLDFVAAQASYALPALVLGDSIRSIYLAGSTTPLERITFDEYSRTYTGDEQGTPVQWCKSTTTPNTIIFGPKPASSSTNAVTIHYLPVAEQMHRVTHGLTITAFPASSSMVELSAAVPAYQLQVGDELGITTTTQIDGTTFSDTTASRWFPVTALDYGGTNSRSRATLGDLGGMYTSALGIQTGTSVIIAQVPLAERLYPDKLGMIPVYLALAYYFMGVSSSASAYYRSLADQEIMGFAAEDVGTINNWPQAGNYALKG